MEALGTKDFAVDFPFVGSDDLLDFSLDVELDESNKENINFSKSSSSVVNGGSSSLPVTAEGEEDLEWLYAFPPVPVEFDILDDKPDIGVLRQHSPDSVLENVVSSGEAYARSGVDNRIYQGIFRQLPSGFPYFVRKKRIGRKRRTGFGQDKHLLLVGHEVSVVNVRNYDRQEEPATPVPTIGGRNGVSTGGRRSCLHCGTDTTPQWRVGPMGPKTLCNACGVRYNSGRLVPEYRPACSPTFSARLHSNSHRKIIEMRKQKQVGMVKDSF